MTFELDDYMTEYKMPKEHGSEKSKGKIHPYIRNLLLAQLLCSLDSSIDLLMKKESYDAITKGKYYLQHCCTVD